MTARNIFFLVANGTFDTSLDALGFPSQRDYGNAFVKLSTSGNSLAAADYFNMFDTVNESNNDEDLGSGGGAMLLPDMTDAQGRTLHLKELRIGAGLLIQFPSRTSKAASAKQAEFGHKLCVN